MQNISLPISYIFIIFNKHVNKNNADKILCRGGLTHLFYNIEGRRYKGIIKFYIDICTA